MIRNFDTENLTIMNAKITLVKKRFAKTTVAAIINHSRKIAAVDPLDAHWD